MKVRFHRGIGIIFLGMAMVYWIFHVTSGNESMVLPIIGFIVAIAMVIQTLIQPYIDITGHTVTVRPLVGPFKRTIEFNKIEIEQNHLYAITNGNKKNIAIEFIADGKDWKELNQYLLNYNSL